jgi:hypothetical protein
MATVASDVGEVKPSGGIAIEDDFDFFVVNLVA